MDLLNVWKKGEKDSLVESQAYSYWIGDLQEHRILEFGVGTDCFSSALDEPLCSVLLEAHLRVPQCKVLWYPSARRRCIRVCRFVQKYHCPPSRSPRIVSSSRRRMTLSSGSTPHRTS